MNNNDENKNGYFSSLTGIRRAVPVLLTALAVFIAVCYITNGTGILGDGISSVLLGLFSYGAYAIPLLLIVHAFFYPEDYAKGLTLSRSIFSLITVLIVSAVEYTVVFWSTELVFAPVEFYTSASAGGFIGSIIAFGIINVLGHVGILILAAAIIAIYITFFFTRGDGAFSRVVIAFVGFVVNILAAIERFIKKVIKARNDKKAAKLLEEEESRAKELLDDQFFAVDNGMKELKIGELGIHESRAQSAAEENPTLQSKVFHKSASNSTEKAESDGSYQAQKTMADEPLYKQPEAPKEKRPLDLTYGIKAASLSEIAPPKTARASTIRAEATEVKADTKTSRDDSADSVFTKDFDPFDLVFAQNTASRPSSKAAPKVQKSGISELTTPLSAITEEDLVQHKRELESKKRIEAFEERKRQIIESMRTSSHAPTVSAVKEDSETAARSDAEQGSIATPSHSTPSVTPMPVGETVSASSVTSTPVSETAAEAPSISENKSASVPSVTGESERTASAESTKTVEFSFAPEKKPTAPTVSESIKMVFEKPDFVTDEDEEAAAHIAEIVERSVPGYTRSANKSYTYTKVTVTDEPLTAEADKLAEDTREYVEEAVTEPAVAVTEPSLKVYAEAVNEPTCEYATEFSEVASNGAETDSDFTAHNEEYVFNDGDAHKNITVTQDPEKSNDTSYFGEDSENYGFTAEHTPVKVINEYTTQAEEPEDEDEAQFKPFEMPEPITASKVESLFDEPKEELKIERTVLSPTPDSAYSSVSAARDARYTLIDENMPISGTEYENEPVIDNTIEWASVSTPESDDGRNDYSDEGTTLVFDGDISPEEDSEPKSDDAESIFGSVIDEADGTELSEADVCEIFDGEVDAKAEEIPLEEQNPYITEQQRMFPSIFGKTEVADAHKDEDNGTADVESEGDAEPMPKDEPEGEDGNGFVNEAAEELADNFAQEMDEKKILATLQAALSEYKDGDDEPLFDADELENDTLFDTDEPDDEPYVAPVIPPKKEEKPKQKNPDYSKYEFPPIDLLGVSEQVSDENVQYEIQENADRLIDTLASFDVTASIKGVDRGPRITRYEVVPAKGVMVRRVLALENDIALNLAAESIRMEAPIPGKSAVGVEIPNKTSSTVRLRDLLETEEFKSAKSKTTVCLGKDVAGEPMFADIAKMPHTLIAGATGMGKSVCINSLMISMLFKARPDEVKFIMIDPKQVEFTMYNGIPHLLVPIVTDVKQAAGALMWAVEEMERRYSVFQEACVKNIDAYNEKVQIKRELGDPMHRIVIVIDEFAELIMQVKNPVESLVIRIAQKARAAGIHLVIGTQKPVKEVITGLIKSNIPTKMSCKVLSNKDSMLMFDKVGAEKLLDKGDMLVSFPSSPKPMRVQGTFVNDTEVEAVMDHLKQFSGGANYDESVMDGIKRATDKCTKGGDGDSDGGSDSGSGEGYLNDRQFIEAVEVAVNSGKISTSLLQRRLSIGYGKAAKFIDVMCDMGVVGEPNGQKPRDVLISADEWREKLSRTMID
ncbi:MAG: DNA translocase FtsK 4TM domain-containing protein [Clostridia bacterium]|nr:DNA translocase FtsK 4TM domain-containing protein [Clostridia bacterium]